MLRESQQEDLPASHCMTVRILRISKSKQQNRHIKINKPIQFLCVSIFETTWFYIFVIVFANILHRDSTEQ